MDWVINLLLPLAGAILAIIALTYAVSQVRSKVKSQWMFAQALRSHETELHKMELLLQHERQQQEMENELANAIETLRQLLSTLPKDDQRRVSEGLLQPTEKGQRNFIGKIVTMAKSEEARGGDKRLVPSS